MTVLAILTGTTILIYYLVSATGYILILFERAMNKTKGCTVGHIVSSTIKYLFL